MNGTEVRSGDARGAHPMLGTSLAAQQHCWFDEQSQELPPSVSQSRIKLNPNVIDAGMTLMAIRTYFIGERGRRRKHFGPI